MFFNSASEGTFKDLRFATAKTSALFVTSAKILPLGSAKVLPWLQDTK